MAFDTYTPPNPWWLTIKNIVFPIFCRRCSARILTDENGYYCPACWDLCEPIRRPFCIVCGHPFAGQAGFATPANFACDRCREEDARPFNRMIGAALYEDPLAEAIRLFKFEGRTRLARPLGLLMAEFALRELECDHYARIVPVPLHRVRQRDRGFNQAELLAREILPAFPNATLDLGLNRIRPTRAQSRLSGEEERRKNVAGAFAVPKNISFEGHHVLLVDDVVTTGGTVRECARALQRARAESVDILAVALPRRRETITPSPVHIGLA